MNHAGAGVVDVLGVGGAVKNGPYVRMSRGASGASGCSARTATELTSARAG
jgi:hypothetical protein